MRQINKKNKNKKQMTTNACMDIEQEQVFTGGGRAPDAKPCHHRAGEREQSLSP